MTDIPSTLSEVDAAWLDARLAEAGHDVPAVADLSVAPMDGFVGALGEVAIFTVGWTEDRPGLPTRFVAKCPLDDDIARLYNDVMQYYVREHGFYSDLVDRVDMRIPKAWINLFDPESGAGFLMLDYVDSLSKGDVLVGCGVDEMKTLVSDLARMHGERHVVDGGSMQVELGELPARQLLKFGNRTHTHEILAIRPYR